MRDRLPSCSDSGLQAAAARRCACEQAENDVSALRALRRATDNYVIVLLAGLEALDDAALARSPQLVNLKTALAIATGRRGSGGLGTPVGIRSLLSRLLGESPDVV